MTIAAAPRRRVGELPIEHQPGDVPVLLDPRELSAKAAKLRAEAIADGLSVEEADAAFRRVALSRARMDAFLVQRHAPEMAIWHPTAERVARSTTVRDGKAFINGRPADKLDGIELIDEGGKLGLRTYVPRPLSLSGVREQMIHIAGLRKGDGMEAVRVKRSMTPLDKAIQTVELGAIERFATACGVASGYRIKTQNLSGVPGGGDPTAAPIADWELREISAYRQIHERLSPSNQRYWGLFFRLMANDSSREEGDEHIVTLTDLGGELCGSRDERRCVGAYIAVVRMLGQQLYFHYVELEVDRARRAIEKRRLKKLQVSAK